MTTPMPADITAILADLLIPLPDPAHDLLRAKVVAAMQAVWNYHVDLLGQIAQTQTDATSQQSALDALTARVAALEPAPPAPAP